MSKKNNTDNTPEDIERKTELPAPPTIAEIDDNTLSIKFYDPFVFHRACVQLQKEIKLELFVTAGR